MWAALQEQVKELSYEKESVYRDLYRPHLQLSKGLQPIIEELYRRQVPMAVGSSADDENIDFVLDGLNIRRYFKAVVNSTQVTHGKPHPECFLKCAAALQRLPQRCVVFEDAVAGVQAALAAGAKAIAITSVMPREALRQADLVIDSFEEVNVETILQMVQSLK
ncbi:hypothetical protein FACS189452_10490 [Bacteroidia bacterium]|nr:hypothetical protein FACS189452_10490 [Bacteroidia bacterium]